MWCLTKDKKIKYFVVFALLLAKSQPPPNKLFLTHEAYDLLISAVGLAHLSMFAKHSVGLLAFFPLAFFFDLQVSFSEDFQ